MIAAMHQIVIVFFIRFAQPKITSFIISNKNIRTLVKTQRETPYEFPHSIN